MTHMDLQFYLSGYYTQSFIYVGYIIICVCVCTLPHPVAESQVRSTTYDADALGYIEISILGNGAARFQLVYLVPLSAFLGKAV